VGLRNAVSRVRDGARATTPQDDLARANSPARARSALGRALRRGRRRYQRTGVGSTWPMSPHRVERGSWTGSTGLSTAGHAQGGTLWLMMVVNVDGALPLPKPIEQLRKATLETGRAESHRRLTAARMPSDPDSADTLLPQRICAASLCGASEFRQNAGQRRRYTTQDVLAGLSFSGQAKAWAQTAPRQPKRGSSAIARNVYRGGRRPIHCV
jgi:hypothetical protein